MSNLSIVISAPSGAGKSTIIHKILSECPFLDFAISSTTRPMREGEVNAKDYHFISADQFQKEIDAEGFVEWAVVHDNYYGTSQKEVDRIVKLGKIPLFDVDVQGAKSLRNNLYGAVFIFILPPSFAELERRLRSRQTDSEKQITLRLARARDEIRQSSLFDYIVINEDLECATADVMSIIRASQMRHEYSEHKIDKILGELA